MAGQRAPRALALRRARPATIRRCATSGRRRHLARAHRRSRCRPVSVYDWAVRPDCGAVVVFSGTVRDHAEGRAGVRASKYEAYEEQVVPRASTPSRPRPGARWPTTGRVALLHRTGPLELGESSVVVAVSAPHRGEAFEAARFGIDTLKASVPIWKRETWAGGAEWAPRRAGAHRRRAERRRARLMESIVFLLLAARAQRARHGRRAASGAQAEGRDRHQRVPAGDAGAGARGRFTPAEGTVGCSASPAAPDA